MDSRSLDQSKREPFPKTERPEEPRGISREPGASGETCESVLRETGARERYWMMGPFYKGACQKAGPEPPGILKTRLACKTFRTFTETNSVDLVLTFQPSGELLAA